MWVVPIKRSSLSKSTRFSSFLTIRETPLFLLQRRKKTSAPSINNPNVKIPNGSGNVNGNGKGTGRESEEDNEENHYNEYNSDGGTHADHNNNNTNNSSATTSSATHNNANGSGTSGSSTSTTPVQPDGPSHTHGSGSISHGNNGNDSTASTISAAGAAVSSTSALSSSSSSSSTPPPSSSSSSSTSSSSPSAVTQVQSHSSSNSLTPSASFPAPSSLSSSSSAPSSSSSSSVPPPSLRPIGRIVTKGIFPYYEVAHAYSQSDFDLLCTREWKYVEEEMVQLMPPHLNQKDTMQWVLAHFTQLALEEKRQVNAAGKGKKEGGDGGNTNVISTTLPLPPPSSSSSSSSTTNKMLRGRWPFKLKSKVPSVSVETQQGGNGNKQKGFLDVNSPTHASQPLSPSVNSASNGKSNLSNYTVLNNHYNTNTTSSVPSPTIPKQQNNLSVHFTASTSSPPLSSDDSIAPPTVIHLTDEDDEEQEEEETETHYDIDSHEFTPNDSDEQKKMGGKGGNPKYDANANANANVIEYDHHEEYDENDHDHEDESDTGEEFKSISIFQQDGNGANGRRSVSPPPISSSSPSITSSSSSSPSSVLNDLNFAADHSAMLQSLLSVNSTARYLHQMALLARDFQYENESLNSQMRYRLSQYGEFTFEESRFGPPIVLRGMQKWMATALIVNSAMLLIRDSSLTSFLIYFVVVNAAIFFLIGKGKPISIAIHLAGAKKKSKLGETDNNLSNVNNGINMNNVQNPNNINMGMGQSSMGMNPMGMNNSNNSENTMAVEYNQNNIQNDNNQNDMKSAQNDLQKAKRSSLSTSSPTPSAPSNSSSSLLSNPSSDSSSPLKSSAVPSNAKSVSASSKENKEESKTKSSKDPFPSSSVSSFSLSTSFTEVVSGCGSLLELPSVFSPLKGKLTPGSTIRYVDLAQSSSGTWSNIDYSTFNVRVGPNYKKNKKKSSSGPAMYECIGVDIFNSEQKVDHVASLFKLPLPSDPANPHVYNDECFRSCGVPELLIVQFQIPLYDPGYIWNKKDDGDTISCIFFFKLNEKTKRELMTDATPAAKLLKKFIKHLGDGGDQNHGRMKAIPRVVDPDNAPFGKTLRTMVSSYNAKPFLTGPYAHGYIRGSGYLEVDIDVHHFSFIARKAAFSFLDTLPQLIVDVGLVVEGHTDEELPEQLLCCLRVNKVDIVNATNLTTLAKSMQ